MNEFVKKADDLGIENRQKILDAFRSGIKIGDIASKFEIETLTVCEVVTRNITSVDVLNNVSI